MTFDHDRIQTFDTDTQQALVAYTREHFAPEDAALTHTRRNTVAQGLPEIQIRPEEGQMLQFLARSIGARRILEIGTLAGYSGIWLARALPEDGQLITLEMDVRHARIAREHFAQAGVADRVTIIEGDAQASMAELAAAREGAAVPFDMVFIDADKDSYPAYLAWSLENVRPGGLITAHNAFRGGALVADGGDSRVAATRQFLQTLANHDRLISTIVPVGDGIAAAIVTG